MSNFEAMKINRAFIKTMFYALVAAACAACGDSDSFRVKGRLTDGSSINIRYVCYSNEKVHTGLTASTDGKFEFTDHADAPAVVEIYDNEYRLLGRLIAADGEDIDVEIDRHNPYSGKVSGNKYNKELTEFFKKNGEILRHGSTGERNRVVAEYALENPGSAVAMMLMATEFDGATERDAVFCDSVMKTMNDEARILDRAEAFAALAERVASEASREPVLGITYKAKGNNTRTFATQRARLSVIAVSDENHGRDSVVDALRILARHEKKGRFALLDLSVDADTVAWSRSVRKDSATWEQGWAAGAISGQALQRLGIPGLPYFILTDSTGAQLWRGRSATQAVSHAVQHISETD